MDNPSSRLVRHRILPRAEIIHFYDGHCCIWSRHNQVVVERDRVEYRLQLPSEPLDHIAGWSRIGRRALRLDKCNVVPADDDFETLVIVRQGNVFHYDSRDDSLKQTLQLQNCRNVLHQSIARDGEELFLGEYGANGSRDSVPVYKSCDGGRSWDVIHEFSPGKIKHTHGCYFDPFEEKIWVLTGDFKGECFMLKADRNFKDVEILGDGSQDWRACNLFFGPNSIYWMMDSQLETSFVMHLPRRASKPRRVRALPGPAWYIKALDDDVFLGATSCEVGPGVHDNFAHLYASSNLENWQECERFAHDRLPKRYLKFGVIGFADGRQSSDRFAMFGEGLSGFDGKAGLFGLPDGLLAQFTRATERDSTVWNHLLAVYELTSSQVACGPQELEHVTEQKPSFRRAPLSLLRAMLIGNDLQSEHAEEERRWRNALLRFVEFQHRDLDNQLRKVHGLKAPTAAVLLAACLLSSCLAYEDARYLNAAFKVVGSRVFQDVRYRDFAGMPASVTNTLAATEVTLGLEFALHLLKQC
jgi:hypothetical protein